MRSLPAYGAMLPYVITAAAAALVSDSHIFERQDPNYAIASNFPDPCIMQGPAGMFWSYATQYGPGKYPQIQVASSSDGITWTRHLNSDGSGLDVLPQSSIKWAPAGAAAAAWAPDVQYFNGKFNMYFAAALATNPAFHCVGFATSSSPTGPFEPQAEPWVCNTTIGGQIDPDQFLDPATGKRYVVYKVDGNSLNLPNTPIMLQEVSATDGVTKVGSAIELIDRDSGDGPLIEAPSLVTHGGTYYLTFSSNNYKTKLYDTSFAYATSVTGPWTKAHVDAPILTSNIQNLIGPGGADMLIDSKGVQRIVWHSWNDMNFDARYMYAATMTLNGKGANTIEINFPS